jgi:hypothetical protein
MRQGKGAAAGYLIEWAQDKGLNVASRGFADRVKLCVARLYKPDAELTEAVKWIDKIKDLGFVEVNSFIVGPDQKPQKVTLTDSLIREQLERMGDQVGRQLFGENFWIDQLLPDDDNWMFRFSDMPPDLAIIHDMRYDNEMDRVRANGGHAWLIVGSSGQAPDDSHDSRRGIDPERYDVTIVNDGSLDDLRKKVFETAERVLV